MFLTGRKHVRNTLMYLCFAEIVASSSRLGLRWSICIMKPLCWLVQLYYFVHLEFLSFSPTPDTFPNIKHLYFPVSHLTPVQGQTELPAAPLSFASMPVRLQSICFIFSLFIIFTPCLPQKRISHNCLQFIHVHNTLFRR